MTVKDAIENRRSIRKFKPDAVSDEILFELLDAARLAPSGCNAQPWRFRIVRDASEMERLCEAAHGQQFVMTAPAVIVCCVDVKGYLDGTVSGVQDLEERGVIDGRISGILKHSAEESKKAPAAQILPRIQFNAAIAIEHIVLRALDFGLGTCWVRLLDAEKVRSQFGWDENIGVVALLPVGYPDEDPKPRKRMPREEMMI